MHICSHKYHGIRRVSAGLAKSRGRAATALLELAISRDIQTKRREVLYVEDVITVKLSVWKMCRFNSSREFLYSVQKGVSVEQI